MMLATSTAAALVLAQAFPGVIPWNPLYVYLMVASAGIVLLVAVLVALVLRYRRAPSAGLPPQTHGNTRLEIMWTIAPALLIAVTFGLSVAALAAGPTPGGGLPPGQQPDIEVIGHQWWWEFRYPKAGVVTANVLHLPVGRRLLVTITSADVQHGFWLPELGQKMDMFPNKTNYVWLEARQPGAYNGACTEFCGTQHAWMRLLAIAQPEAEFEAWLAAQRAPAAAPASPQATRGLTVFTANACASCHMIAGTAANGQAAPNLTHFASRPTISAGVLANTPENLARYLRDPQAVKPGILMPNFRLSDADIQALVAYLEGLP